MNKFQRGCTNRREGQGRVSLKEKPISGIAIPATDCRLIIRSQLFAPRSASRFSEGPRKNIIQDANRPLQRPVMRQHKDSHFGPSSLRCTCYMIHGNTNQNILRSMHLHFSIYREGRDYNCSSLSLVYFSFASCVSYFITSRIINQIHSDIIPVTLQ